MIPETAGSDAVRSNTGTFPVFRTVALSVAAPPALSGATATVSDALSPPPTPRYPAFAVAR